MEEWEQQEREHPRNLGKVRVGYSFITHDHAAWVAFENFLIWLNRQSKLWMHIGMQRDKG